MDIRMSCLELCIRMPVGSPKNVRLKETLLRCDERVYYDIDRIKSSRPLALYKNEGLFCNLGRLTESLNERPWPVA